MVLLLLLVVLWLLLNRRWSVGTQGGVKVHVYAHERVCSPRSVRFHVCRGRQGLRVLVQELLLVLVLSVIQRRTAPVVDDQTVGTVLVVVVVAVGGVEGPAHCRPRGTTAQGRKKTAKIVNKDGTVHSGRKGDQRQGGEKKGIKSTRERDHQKRRAPTRETDVQQKKNVQPIVQVAHKQTDKKEGQVGGGEEKDWCTATRPWESKRKETKEGYVSDDTK